MRTNALHQNRTYTQRVYNILLGCRQLLCPDSRGSKTILDGKHYRKKSNFVQVLSQFDNFIDFQTETEEVGLKTEQRPGLVKFTWGSLIF